MSQPRARDGGGLANQTIVQHLREGGSVAGFPGAPIDNQHQQSRTRTEPLPHRAAMERSFGRSLGHLDVRTGADALGAIGVNALAAGNRLAFKDSSPSPALVAHEVTHALQSERSASGSSFVAPRGSDAEREADAFADHVARRGAGASLPRPSARSAGQVHLDQPGWKTSFSANDQQLLEDWIKGETPPPPPKFDPSLDQFKLENRLAQWTSKSPGASSSGSTSSFMTMPSKSSDADSKALADWIKDTPAPADAHSHPSATPLDPLAHSNPFPMLSDPLAHKSDEWQPMADPFKPKYDPSVCHTNIHGVVYQRMAPPAPAAPTWSAPDAATGQAAVKKEAQSTDETVDQIELQVLSAKAAAIGAAAAKGKLPEDLQQLWQTATLNAEALRLSSTGLARAKPGGVVPPPPKPATTTPPPAGVATAPEIDTAAAEATRTAIDAFYWSLIDALQVKEAEADSFATQFNGMHAATKSKPPPCQTNCHATPTNDFSWTPLVPAPKQSPAVKSRAKALATAATLADWKGALNDFDITSTVQLEDLLHAILPADAKELKQLSYAADLRDRLQSLQAMQATAVRIPAVFYPENDLATETGTDGKTTSKPQGYSWYLFVYQRPDGYFVLKDLTSGREFTNTEGESNLESVARHSPLAGPTPTGLLDQYPEGVMQRLIGQLNSSLHMPKGMLYFTLPGGGQRSLETTEPWELSDWLRAIGLTLAAIGIVALTGGAGTAAGIAFVGAGLAGAASSKAALEEMEKQGIATDSDRARAYLNIAVDLIGALAGGVGMIARAPSMFGQVALMADRIYIPLRAAAAAGELAQAALMTHDFVQNLQALAAQPDSKERTTGILKLVGMGIAMGALTFVSLRGAVHEIGSGARPRVIANGDGTYSLAGPSGLPVAEGSGGFKWKAKADVAVTVEDPTIGKKSVVIDVEKDANGLVTGVAVRKGTAASAADVALHEKVADMVARYGGAQGRIRNLWRDVLAKFGFRRPPVELELEIYKLEQAANARVKTLSAPGVTDADHAAAEKELAHIEHNLEIARANAEAALKKPAQTVAQRAQIWMKDQPEGLPSAPEGTQWVRNEAGQWDLAATGPHAGGAEIRAVYSKDGELVGISNREQVSRARVVGRTVDEVKDRLEAIGYSVETVVDASGKTVRRLKPNSPNMVALELDDATGVVKGSAVGSEKWVPPKSYNASRTHGRWVGGDDLRGNTGWIDDRPDVVRIVGRGPNGEANPIAFDHGRVDFSKYNQETVKVPGLVGEHVDDMGKIRDAIADKHGLAVGQAKSLRREAALNWLKTQPDGYGGIGLAPHHAGGDTIELIPLTLHKAVRHTDVFAY
jgi:hypothetical protein